MAQDHLEDIARAEEIIELLDELAPNSAEYFMALAYYTLYTLKDYDQAYDYLAEKGRAIKVGDKEDSYNTGLRQFLDEKSYKPTFEPFKLGTQIEDKTA